MNKKNNEVSRKLFDGADAYLKLVCNRCARDEEYTLDQEQFNKVFTGGLKEHRDRIEQFCTQHALNFTVNRRKTKYKFSLIEGD